MKQPYHVAARIGSFFVLSVAASFSLLKAVTFTNSVVAIPDAATDYRRIGNAIVASAEAVPWWVLTVALVASYLLTAYLFRVTYSREVIIKSDNKLSDLRSQPDVELDFSGGNNVLIRPQSDVILLPPDRPHEGVFKVFILFGTHAYRLSFDQAFEILGSDPSRVERESSRLYELQIVVVKDGRSFRYFVSEALAAINDIENLRRDTVHLIDEVESRLQAFAFAVS